MSSASERMAYPPHFTHIFSIVEPLRPLSYMSVKCAATGLPLPQIVWTLDGQTISSDERIRIGDYVTSDGVLNSFVNIWALRSRDVGL